MRPQGNLPPRWATHKDPATEHGNAVLFYIGRARRAAGGKVIYFAGYKTLVDRYRVEDIDAASDVVVWP